MKIGIVAPVRPGTTSGNDVTAARWARRLGELGHRTEVIATTAYGRFEATADPCPAAEISLVLHARRCSGAVASAKEERPDCPVVVALTGTDLYVDLPDDADARAAVALADGLIVLQAKARDRLGAIDPSLAAKAVVVHQSVDLPVPPRDPDPERVAVAVLAHLREVKDPLLTARAARRLDPASRIAVEHAGAAHDDGWRATAEAEQAANPRYTWHGELQRAAAMALLARSHVLACTSRSEGGSNVVAEALALGVPVVGTRVDGTTGVLGDDHPGLVEVGDDEALAGVLQRLERDPDAYAELAARSLALRHLTEPAHEREQLRSLITNL